MFDEKKTILGWMYNTVPSLVFQAYFELNEKTIFQKIVIIKTKRNK